MSRGEVELVDPAREDSRARETPRGGDDVETAGEMEASTSPVGERLAGINDGEQKPHYLAMVTLGCRVKRLESFIGRDRRVGTVAQ